MCSEFMKHKIIYIQTPPKKSGEMELLRIFESGKIICECLHGLAQEGVVRDLIHWPYPQISDCHHATDFVESIEHLEELGYTEIPHE